MLRKLKLLSMTIAVLALFAVAATAAQAVEFHSEIEKSFSLGEQKTENVVTVNGGSIKCKKSIFTGEGVGTKKSASDFTKPTVTVSPAYSECSAFGVAATVTNEGCRFRADQPNAELVSTVAIVCEAGKFLTVKVTAAGCTVKFGSQEKLSKVKFKNEGAGTSRDLLMTAEVEKVSYTTSGGICGSSGAGGKYTGTVTGKGYKDAAHTTQIGVWVE